MSDDQKRAIPKKHLDFCRKIAALCKEANVDNFSARYRPHVFDPDWRDDITMSWSNGRHGDSVNDLVVTSTVTIQTKIGKPS